MFYIGQLTACEKDIGPAVQKLLREITRAKIPPRRDTLKLIAKEAERRRLESLSPPTMGKMERFLSKIRGTGDKARFPGDVRLDNFAKVDDTVYRGGMPVSGAEFQKLKDVYGVKHIIDLRGVETTKAKDIEEFGKGWAKFHGLEYHHRPMNSHHAPTKDELAKIFDVIKSANGKGEKVYIHCKHGIDRTGAVVAAYEAKLGRSPEAIYKHFRKHGYNWLHQYTRPEQKKFVQSVK